jgi:hypothetical protein
VLVALVSIVTLRAWRLSQGGLMPVETTAWYHQTAPTWVDGLALVRRHLWHARYVVNSAADPEWARWPVLVMRFGGAIQEYIDGYV